MAVLTRHFGQQEAAWRGGARGVVVPSAPSVGVHEAPADLPTGLLPFPVDSMAQTRQRVAHTGAGAPQEGSLPCQLALPNAPSANVPTPISPSVRISVRAVSVRVKNLDGAMRMDEQGSAAHAAHARGQQRARAVSFGQREGVAISEIRVGCRSRQQRGAHKRRRRRRVWEAPAGSRRAAAVELGMHSAQALHHAAQLPRRAAPPASRRSCSGAAGAALAAAAHGPLPCPRRAVRRQAIGAHTLQGLFSLSFTSASCTHKKLEV